MANKVLGFTIEINGQKAAIDRAEDLRAAIRQVNKALKETSDNAEYDKLEQELIQLKARLKEVTKQQRDAANAFAETLEGVGAYDKLSKRLNRLRKQYKDLAASQKTNTKEAQALLEEIQQLDKQLKEIDAEVGQFQRNVGNYTGAVDYFFQHTGAQVGVAIEQFRIAGNIATKTGRLMARTIVVVQVLQYLQDVAQAIGDWSTAAEEARAKVSRNFQIIGAEAREVSAQLNALARTFKVEFDSLNGALGVLSDRLGVDVVEGAELMGKALAAAVDPADVVSRIERDIRTLASYGLSPDSALALIVDASNRNVDVEKFAVAIAKLGERSAETVKKLEQGLGKEGAQRIFEAFEDEPVRALKLVGEEVERLGVRSKEAAAVIKAVFSEGGFKDIAFITGLDKLPATLDELIEKTDDYTAEQLDLLNANLELARAEQEVSIAAEEVQDAWEATGNSLKRILAKVVLAVLNFVKAIPAAVTYYAAFVKQSYLNAFNAIKTASLSVAATIADAFATVTPGDISKEFAEFAKQARADAEAIRKEYKTAETAAAEAVASYTRRKEAAKEQREAEEAAAKASQRRAEAEKQQQKQAAEAAKAAAKAEAEKAKATEAYSRAAEVATKTLNQLADTVATKRAASIADTFEREAAQLELATKKQAAAIRERLEQIKQQAEAAREAAARAFGVDSAEYARAVAEWEARVQEAERVAAEAIEEVRKEQARKLQAIEEARIQAEADARAEALQSELDGIRLLEDVRVAAIEDAMARGAVAVQEGQKEIERITKESLRAQVAAINEALKGATEEQAAALIRTRADLSRQLAKIAEQERKSRAESIEATTDTIATNTLQGLEVLNQFISASEQRELAATQRRIQQREQAIKSLEEKLQQASGQQAAILQNQLQAERDALEKERASFEKAEKEKAKREQQIAILRAIINGAAAIVKTAANLGYPAAIPFQIALAAQTAAQVAAIKAQKFARGGRIEEVELVPGASVPAISGQKVRARRNLKRPAAGGDTVLAVVKPGEVVLNEEQQRRLGGAAVFRAIGVPGFAGGGVVPPTPVSFSSASGGLGAVGATLARLAEAVSATNDRLDRLRVEVVVEDIERILSQKEAAKKVTVIP